MLVFLIGMMGSGKTTIGSELSIRLNLPLYDTDHLLVEQLGMPISEYFELAGEDAFRGKEHQLLQNWKITTGIVSTGGGLPCFNSNLEKLKSIGTVVYLTCDISTIIQRVSKAKNERPLLSKLSENELYMKLIALIAERETMYTKAHFSINTNRDLDQVIDEIIALLA